jgi:hypothetical protein
VAYDGAETRDSDERRAPGEQHKTTADEYEAPKDLMQRPHAVTATLGAALPVSSGEAQDDASRRTVTGTVVDTAASALPSA